MPETFDLIVRGGEVANHAGRGMADVGVTAGRIAATHPPTSGRGGLVGRQQNATFKLEIRKICGFGQGTGNGREPGAPASAPCAGA